MPPIQPLLVKQQAARLTEYSDRPDRFIKELGRMLEFYGERAFRQGKSGSPKPLTQAFDVPPPLLKILINEFSLFVRKDPARWLVICDRLWVDPHIEFRLLAAGLLGKLPIEFSGEVLERIRTWTPVEKERSLQLSLLSQGTVTLRQEKTPKLFALARDWLSSPVSATHGLAFLALVILVQDEQFENLPLLYALVTPYIINIDVHYRQELVNMMSSLARRSPTETAYFLRNAMESARSQDTAWLIRQLLPDFPLATRESLRITVRR